MSVRISDFAYVVFADDWGRHPSSCQHLFKRILPKADVLWVNTVGLRTPRLSLYDLRRSLEILRGWLLPPKAKQVENPSAAASEQQPSARQSLTHPSATQPQPANPRVTRPIMLPFFHWRWADKLNQFLIRRHVEKTVMAFACGKPLVLVSALPIIPDLFRSPIWARKVYYCVDDFTTWPGVSGDTMLRLEEALIPHCDVVIATSQGLLETRGPKAPRATLLTHGVDAAHFGQARMQKPHPDFANLPQPVLGMFGSFDKRVDAGILLDLAKRYPHGTVMALGPVDRDLGEFSGHANLRFPGPKAYADLPACIAAFDVLILPYVIDASTDKINPLKLKEYLATGKPVVTTPLPEARRLAEFCRVVDRDHFAAAVADALQEASQQSSAASPPGDRGGLAPGLSAFLAGESWEGKAETFFAQALEGL